MSAAEITIPKGAKEMNSTKTNVGWIVIEDGERISGPHTKEEAERIATEREEGEEAGLVLVTLAEYSRDEAIRLMRRYDVEPEQLVDLWGGEIVEGDYVPDGEPWCCTDGRQEKEYPYADSGREAAEDYFSSGDWPPDVDTYWVHLSTFRRGLYAGGETYVEEEDFRFRVEPAEPECIDDDGHDWQSPHEIVGGIEENPGVWGHGGGVLIHECCMRCGCRRETDTWAQDRETGEQGLRSVSYEPGYYEDQLAEMDE